MVVRRIKLILRSISKSSGSGYSSGPGAEYDEKKSCSIDVDILGFALLLVVVECCGLDGRECARDIRELCRGDTGSGTGE